MTQQISESQEFVTIAVIVLGVMGVALLAAVVAGVGLFVLYAILTEAMKRGYDVRDTKFKMAAGEGQMRQEHELAFNLTQPGKGGTAALPTPAPEAAPVAPSGPGGPGGLLAALPGLPKLPWPLG